MINAQADGVDVFSQRARETDLITKPDMSVLAHLMKRWQSHWQEQGAFQAMGFIDDNKNGSFDLDEVCTKPQLLGFPGLIVSCVIQDNDGMVMVKFNDIDQLSAKSPLLNPAYDSSLKGKWVIFRPFHNVQGANKETINRHTHNAHVMAGYTCYTFDSDGVTPDYDLFKTAKSIYHQGKSKSYLVSYAHLLNEPLNVCATTEVY